MPDIEVEFARPDGSGVHVERRELPSGCTVGDALHQWGVEAEPGRVGVFGRLVSMDQELRSGDRVEIYAPLPKDPKVARRERARKARRG